MHGDTFTNLGPVTDECNLDPVIARWNGNSEPRLVAGSGHGSLRKIRTLDNDIGTGQGLARLPFNRPFDITVGLGQNSSAPQHQPAEKKHAHRHSPSSDQGLALKWRIGNIVAS